jgi:hypothetical protein
MEFWSKINTGHGRDVLPFTATAGALMHDKGYVLTGITLAGISGLAALYIIFDDFREYSATGHQTA